MKGKPYIANYSTMGTPIDHQLPCWGHVCMARPAGWPGNAWAVSFLRTCPTASGRWPPWASSTPGAEPPAEVVKIRPSFGMS